MFPNADYRTHHSQSQPMDYSDADSINPPYSSNIGHVSYGGSGVASPLSSTLSVAPTPDVTAQSPGGTVRMGQVVDSNFIQLHNASAEIYQSFKDDVDMLFSGSIPLRDQGTFISRVLSTLEALTVAFNNEKHYLMNDVLCSWALQQQKLSIATLWTQQANYALLTAIDTQFEYFGELLEQTLTGLVHLSNSYPNFGFEDCHARITQLAHLFLFYSIIVSRQPPSVVVKCGDAENHRRSRFWFNTEIRILGGRAFGLNKTCENMQIQAHLITDKKARELRGNGYVEVRQNEHFNVEPNTAIFQLRPTTCGDGVSVTPSGSVSGHVNDASSSHQGFGSGFVAKFDDMRVLKGTKRAADEGRREKVWEKRYHLCFNLHLVTAPPHSIALTGKKVSLPFAILVGPKAEVEARVFLERSFADFVRRPENEPPPSVCYMDMADALEMKFQAILEIPQKSTDHIPLMQPKAFTYQAKQHLIERLKPDSRGHIAVENFLKLPVAEEYCHKKGGVTPSQPDPAASPFGRGSGGESGGTADGEWRLVPFYEWYFKLAEIVNKHLISTWNAGLIFGFCGKEEAEQLLGECKAPTLLIRFSDIEYGRVKISVRDSSGSIRHHWYDHQDLSANSLSHELLHNPKYKGVKCVYPNINIESAIGPRHSKTVSEQPRKPRHLQPSNYYFDNQEPGVKNNLF